MIRYGLINKEEAIELAKNYDHALDPLAARDFCKFISMKESEFWTIINNLYNTNLFLKKNWQMGFEIKSIKRNRG